MFISGKLECAFNSEISMESLDDYYSIRVTLLKALGDTPLQASRKWWSLSRQPDESHNSYFQHLNSLNICHLEEVNTKQDINNLISLSKFLDSLYPSCYLWRDPKSGNKIDGQRYQPGSSRGHTNNDGHNCPLEVSRMYHIVLVLHLRVYSLRETVVILVLMVISLVIGISPQCVMVVMSQAIYVPTLPTMLSGWPLPLFRPLISL